MVESRPIPLGGCPTTGRIITIAEVLPREQRFQAPLGSPAQGSCTRRRAPRTFDFAGHQGLVSGGQKAVGNRDSTLKRCMLNHTLQDPGQKQSFEKSLGQTHSLILESLPVTQEATGTHPGDRDTGSSHLGSSFYHKETGAGKGHFGVLSLVY